MENTRRLGRGEGAIQTCSAQARHVQSGCREGQDRHRQGKEPRAAAAMSPRGRVSVWLLSTKIVIYAYWRKSVGDRKVVKHNP